MAYTVHFTLPVRVPGDRADNEEEARDEAREILYSAPAFDGLDDEVIDMLEDGEVLDLTGGEPHDR